MFKRLELHRANYDALVKKRLSNDYAFLVVLENVTQNTGQGSVTSLVTQWAQSFDQLKDSFESFRTLLSSMRLNDSRMEIIREQIREEIRDQDVIQDDIREDQVLAERQIKERLAKDIGEKSRTSSQLEQSVLEAALRKKLLATALLLNGFRSKR